MNEASKRKYSIDDLITDALAIAGVGLIVYGFWMFWTPGCFIAPGAIFVALSAIRRT